jgi:hypothetical protein
MSMFNHGNKISKVMINTRNNLKTKSSYFL